MNLDECFAEGLLKKSRPDLEKAKLSLKIARKNLNDAEGQLKMGMYGWALIAAYTSMFHAARALLYKDGVKERSHYCVSTYLKEKYAGVIEAKYLHELNVLREQRHRTLYGDIDVKVKEIEEAEAESSIAIASGFLAAVAKILGEAPQK